MTGPARKINLFGLALITLPVRGDESIWVAGLMAHEAATFVSQTNAAFLQYFIEKFKKAEPEFRTLAKMSARLKQPLVFPSACLVDPFVERARKAMEGFPAVLPEGALSDEQQEHFNTVTAFLEAPEKARQAGVKHFIQAEPVEWKAFFDTIESNPLTPQQRLAVVTDEDATLVLAGAGSGKTSVIVAKAAYLIQRGIRKSNEILLLAFGNDAAAEMRSRIEERSGSKVNATTFHALGYEIIRKVEGGSPALAAHASDDAQFHKLLRDILINELLPQKELGNLILKWFSELFWPYKSLWDFETKSAYFQYLEEHELRTLKGDRVRSFEELEIANWLYLNGIDYEYEPDYEHELPKTGRKAYTPDFRLKESGVYIEHFGVRKTVQPDGSMRYTTAPHVDRESYLEEMAWKRHIHAEYGTTLIETFSQDRAEGRLLEALQEKLEPYATPDPIPTDQVFEALTDLGQVDSFTRMLGTFLKHFKNSRSSIEACRSKASRSKDPFRSLAFLKIFEAVYAIYQDRLGDRIDFEDMIGRATKYVESGRYRSPYRHILVDEFQDISEGRAQLLRALIARHADARLFAVGDDWQSIFRFAGSDIHLMRDFGEIFGGSINGKRGIHRTVDLGRTFRSVDKIALPARKFILKNPAQIEKKVIPAGTTHESAIKVAYYTPDNELGILTRILENISGSASESSSVLLLGRYHVTRPGNLSRLGVKFSNLSIRYMTIHASKGLEADHVILLRASSGNMGFPSEIEDDPLLDLILPKPEKFDHAEERRLLYVALTRARKSVYILADREEPSVFVRELIKDPEYEVARLGGPGPRRAEHKCAECGGRMLMQTSKRGRSYFACEHRFFCGATLPPCPVCQKDLPIRDPANPEKKSCSCGADFHACPDCADGWLVERWGRYGNFWGCINYPECEGTKDIQHPRKGKPASLSRK